MKNKNALNPYRIESEDYYFLREILAPWGAEIPDECKREYRARLAQHVDPLEKSAREVWRTAPDGTRYCVRPWLGETEDDLARWERRMSSQPATAGAFYYSAHVARTGRNDKNIAFIVRREIDD